MGKSKAPPPPDYAAAAKEQGTANLAAGQQTAALNRPDQFDANGSQTWALKQGADPKNPQPGDWQVTTSLSPTQQGLKDQQDAVSKQYGDLSGNALTNLGALFQNSFDPSKLPQGQQLTNAGLTPFGDLPQIAKHQYAPGVNQNRNELSAEGLSDFGHVDPTSEASRQRITDALYSRQTAMLDPQMEAQDEGLQSQLAAQGITQGSEAYQGATDQQARQHQQAYAQARNDAILAGGAEDSRIGNQNLGVAQFANSSRGQQFGEREHVAGFNNNNIDTIFNQGLQAAGFNNGVADTEFNQGLQLSDRNSSRRGQQFGENQAMNSANNTFANNALAQAIQQRQLGLNEANALRTGNQVAAPQFQAYGGAGAIGAAPVMQGVTDGYNAQLAQTNANNAGAAGMWKGLTTLGGSAISAWGG